jgi:hypothetical protein
VLGEHVKLNKKKATILGIPLTVLILGAALAVFLTASSPSGSWHTVYEGAIAAGTPDGYGQQISLFRVYQNSTGSWAAVGGDVSAATYTPGTTVTIPSNVPTGLMILLGLNITFAPNAATAMTRARVYITLSPGGSSYMVVSSAVNAGSVWAVTLYYPSVYPFATYWTPATDVTYTVTLAYQAYY